MTGLKLDENDQITKFCAKCGETKPLDEFWKNKTSVDGRQTYCKPCLKNYAPRKTSSRKYESKYSRIRMSDGTRRRVPRDLVSVVRNAQSNPNLADTPTDASGDQSRQLGSDESVAQSS